MPLISRKPQAGYLRFSFCHNGMVGGCRPNVVDGRLSWRAFRGAVAAVIPSAPRLDVGVHRSPRHQELPAGPVRVNLSRPDEVVRLVPAVAELETEKL